MVRLFAKAADSWNFSEYPGKFGVAAKTQQAPESFFVERMAGFPQGDLVKFGNTERAS